MLLYGGYENVAKVLIAAGADLNAKDKDGNTPLRWAALHDHGDVAKMLIDAGADINAKANNGRTALMDAAWQWQQ